MLLQAGCPPDTQQTVPEHWELKKLMFHLTCLPFALVLTTKPETTQWWHLCVVYVCMYVCMYVSYAYGTILPICAESAVKHQPTKPQQSTESDRQLNVCVCVCVLDVYKVGRALCLVHSAVARQSSLSHSQSSPTVTLLSTSAVVNVATRCQKCCGISPRSLH